MAADVLVMQGARASAAMGFVKFAWNILLSVSEGLTAEIVQNFVRSCQMFEWCLTKDYKNYEIHKSFTL